MEPKQRKQHVILLEVNWNVKEPVREYLFFLVAATLVGAIPLVEG
jgi:hypothetical protein